MKNTFTWKRSSSGHYFLWGEYIVGDKEIMAEIKKIKNKWSFCLWTWGADKPRSMNYDWRSFSTAKSAKSAVIDLVTNGEPQV